ncbi:MAG: oxidase [Bacteroidia bacterium]
MAEVKDILIDADYDLVIKDGDLVIGESTDQHQLCILLANKGQYKQFPDVGVGINEFLQDEVDLGDLSSEINEQFEKDGMRITSLKLESIESLRVEAYYQYESAE